MTGGLAGLGGGVRDVIVGVVIAVVTLRGFDALPPWALIVERGVLGVADGTDSEGWLLLEDDGFLRD